MMSNPQAPDFVTLPHGGQRLVWTAIGAVLLVASVAQPIVSTRLAAFGPDQMLAPMSVILGVDLSPMTAWLFAGVFANIDFAWAFAAVKLVAGLAILSAARNLGRGPGVWPQRILTVAAWIGAAAFAAVGLIFLFSVSMFFVLGLPLLPTLAALVAGVVTALVPIRWLLGQADRLRSPGAAGSGVA
jgi:hypothetical protein